MCHFNKKMSTVMLQNKQMNNYKDFYIYSTRVHTQFYANNITFYITLTQLHNGVDTVTQRCGP